VVIILDFISVNHYSDLLDLVAVIYIAILSIYAGTKEFERWFSHYNAHHPGEVFIVSWTITSCYFACCVLLSSERIG